MLENKLKIVISSHNQHKLEEILTIVKQHPQGNLILQQVDFALASDFNLKAPEEDGTTFLENALIKAKFASEATNLIALSDDSGICIKALNDEPSIHSARWMSEHGETETFNKINQLMTNNSNKDAYFYCSICFYFPKEIANKVNIPSQFKNFEGILHGTISDTPLGDKGFAYDKIFIANNYKNVEDTNKTLAQIEASSKNAISHRNLSLNKALDFLVTILPILKN